MRICAAILGLCWAWAAGPSVKADGITYLDISDALMAGDLRAAVNGHRQPFYPLLLGVAARALRVPRLAEIDAVRLTNSLVFLAALVAFDWLLLRWLELLEFRRASTRLSERRPIREETATIIGYVLFISSSLFLVSPEGATPDLCLAVPVLVAGALLVGIHTRGGSICEYLFLGFVLGIGYLTKAAMLPIAIVFLAASIPRPLAAAGARRLLVAFVAFATIAGPMVAALSLQKGRLTFSETGTLNYALSAYDLFSRYWAGSPPGSGVPKHPPRKIHDNPAVYEFSTPLPGTNPLAYDFTYWNEGLQARFSVAAQWKIFRHSAHRFLQVFLNPVQLPWWVFVMGVAVLLLLTGPLDKAGAEGQLFRPISFLLIPSLVAIAMYCAVQFNGRYVGPFMPSLALSLLGGVCIPDNPRMRRAEKYFASAMAIALALSLTFPMAKRMSNLGHRFVHGENLGVQQDWRIAQALRDAGIRDGDAIACIGDSIHVYWARLAGARIIADVPMWPSREDEKFWRSPSAVQAEVLELLAENGARAVVAGPVPAWASVSDWREIPGTSRYLRVVEAERTAESAAATGRSIERTDGQSGGGG
jgi:hypothetical protein